MKTKSGSPQLCRFYAPRFRFPPSSPARGRPGIGLHSICLVDRCDRRWGQKLDQGLRGQWLLGGGWGTAMYTKSGLCRSGGRGPITSMPATSMSSLIGCMPISASPRWRTSQYLSPEPIPAGRPRRHITPPTAPTFFGAVAADRDWRTLQFNHGASPRALPSVPMTTRGAPPVMLILVDLYGVFPVKWLFSVYCQCFVRSGKPFFVPSPAIRFAERAEGVKGPKR